VYSELEEKLWAITGHRIADSQLFNKFGKVRNQIIHLVAPALNLSDLSLNYGFGLVEKMVNEWWNETLLDYASEYDESYLEYVFKQLQRLNINSKYELANDGSLHLK